MSDPLLLVIADSDCDTCGISATIVTDGTRAYTEVDLGYGEDGECARVTREGIELWGTCPRFNDRTDESCEGEFRWQMTRWRAAGPTWVARLTRPGSVKIDPR